MASCQSCCDNKNEKGDLAYVTAKFKKVEQNAREKISGIGVPDDSSVTVDNTTPIQIVNFTHLSGRCGDKIIGVNVQFGAVYYHVYLLDESDVPEIVKILGPKEKSVVITGFR